MTNIDLIASLVSVVITALVLYGISRHIFTKGQVEEAYKFAVWASSAAEEMFAQGNGAMKYDYVRDLLLKRFHISDEDARMLVNAAVLGLRNAGIKPPAAPPAQVVPITPDTAA